MPPGLAKGPATRAGAANPSGAPGGRRRGGASSGDAPVNVCCDVAAWLSDDTKVVTSQSCPTKGGGGSASDSGMLPGSHVLYLWDSRTGQCLLGIPSAHVAPCPVLVSHPLEPTIVASAGGDGMLKVWDLDSGRCLFRHRNILSHGHIDPPSKRGKECGYLDGSFSPDGMTLVLTDDSGRVTIIDSLLSSKEAKESKNIAAALGAEGPADGTSPSPISLLSDGLLDATPSMPDWMREQYFANDYYDLFFDSNGYCIERGSEQPPHLAPRAARCNHTGTPHSNLIDEAFAGLAGPQPLLERHVRWDRDVIRSLSVEVRMNGGLLSQNVQGKRAAINVHGVIGECGLVGTAMPAMSQLLEEIGLSKSASLCEDQRSCLSVSGRLGNVVGNTGHVETRSSSARERPLSNRYRWTGFDEDEEIDIDEEDSDEEYQDNRGHQRLVNSSDEDGNLSDMVDSEHGDDGIMVENVATERGTGRASRRSQSQGAARGRTLGDGSPRRNSGGRRQRRRSRGGSLSSRSRRQESRRRDRDLTTAFEENQRHQPTRVSARQMTTSPSQRRRYDEPESSDDDLVEYMSKNTAPSGDWLEDVNNLGHMYRIPEGGVVHRAWLTRTESLCGMSGTKTYAPQVGDSVVYIPRAHADTVRAFPVGGNQSAPWKSWTSSAWPIVRCVIRDIRYRFPYQDYYRNRQGERCLSVVAILSLEVTGIPQTSADRSFPWPKPDFYDRITRTNNQTFEVSCFENAYAEFVIPEHLFLWRLRELESAIQRQNGPVGVKLFAYFAPVEGQEGHDTEDAELNPYQCTITDLQTQAEDCFHFQGSGFSSIGIVWQASDDEDVICPWEVTVCDKVETMPSPPKLHEGEKVALLKILDELESDRQDRTWFSMPVNTKRYTDYFNMIEVPMDIEKIRKRILAEYYTSRLSVKADVKLIRDNCLKYNGVKASISGRAIELFKRFEELLEEIPEYQVPRAASQHHQLMRSASTESPVCSDKVRSESAQDPPVSSPSPRRSSRLTRRNDETTEEPSENEEDQEIENQGVLTRTASSRVAIHDGAMKSALENLPIQGGQPISTNCQTQDSPATSESTSREKSCERRLTRSATCRGKHWDEGHTKQFSDGQHSTEQMKDHGSSEEEKEPHKYKGDTSDDSDREEESRGRRRARHKTLAQTNKNKHSDTEMSSPSRQSKRLRNIAPNCSDSEEEKKDQGNYVCRRSGRVANAMNLHKRGEGILGEKETRQNRKMIRAQQHETSSASEEMSDEGENSRNTRLRKRRGRIESNAESSDEDDKVSSGKLQQLRTYNRRRTSTYEEVGSSDFYESSSDEESAEERSDGEDSSAVSSDEQDCAESVSSEEAKVSSRRNGQKRQRETPMKRGKRAKRQRNDPDVARGGDLYYPNLPCWPNIPLDKIPKISSKILGILTKKDNEKLFKAPVAEEYPDLADTYLGVIAEPMDFRTIREERTPAYRKISELQDDLILTFKNCCKYNGEGDQYYFYAIEMWKGLNELFKKVCKEEDIRLPRRFA